MQKNPIRVAVVGVGNCCTSLLQGIAKYKAHTTPIDSHFVGLMHPTIGRYTPADIEFVAAFDVNETKIGLSLAEACMAPPNNVTDPYQPLTDVIGPAIVQRGPLGDGVGVNYAQRIDVSTGANLVDVAQVLRDTEANVVVNYLPVGSEEATKLYAQSALEAGCAFVNAIPVFLACDPDWSAKFEKAGLPLLGDDIKSQFGATILHRALVTEMTRRGLTIDETSQLNIGGNMDFVNLMEESRLGSKRKSKRDAVTSMIPGGICEDRVHISPSAYVEHLGDRKWAYIQVQARGFAGARIELEVKLEVEDSPNSAGVVIDAVRCARLAMDRGLGGPLIDPCAFLFKSPPAQLTDDVAFVGMEAFCARSIEEIEDGTD